MYLFIVSLMILTEGIAPTPLALEMRPKEKEQDMPSFLSENRPHLPTSRNKLFQDERQFVRLRGDPLQIEAFVFRG